MLVGYRRVFGRAIYAIGAAVAQLGHKAVSLSENLRNIGGK